MLDSGIVGRVSHPSRWEDEREWLQRLLGTSTTILLPDIVDYEVRRELLRVGAGAGLRRLDAIGSILSPSLTTPNVLRAAAHLWANARRAGRITGPPSSLDADVIIAAQALELVTDGHDVTVATLNVRHLSWFVDARMWSDIDIPI